jgi:hypothetical protein
MLERGRTTRSGPKRQARRRPFRLGGTERQYGQNLPGGLASLFGQLEFKIEQHNNRIQDLNIIVEKLRAAGN